MLYEYSVYMFIDVQLRSNGQPYMFAFRDRTVLILISHSRSFSLLLLRSQSLQAVLQTREAKDASQYILHAEGGIFLILGGCARTYIVHIYM